LEIAKTTFRYTLSIFGVLLFVGIIVYACGETESAPEFPSRSIVDDNLGLSEIWRVSSLSVYRGGVAHPLPIILTPQRIVMVARLYNGGKKVVSFAPSTGLLEWAVSYEGDSVDSVTADEKRLYVASGGEPLRAYELQTGNLAWAGEVLLPERTAHYLAFQNNKLFHYFGNSQVTVFVPDTGEVLEEDDGSSVPSGYYHVIRLSEFELYKSSSSNEMLKVKQENNDIIWSTTIPRSGVMNFPILSNGKLIMASGGWSRTIYAIDFITGQLLWQTGDGFVSNVAVSEGKVYALRSDARLIVFDEATGVELGYVQFNPNQTKRDNAPPYWVGVDEQARIFVYFSDSKELLALELN